MPKLYSKRAFVLSLIALCFSAAGRAQNESNRIAEREAEWQSYQLPAVDFVRYLDSTKSLLIRVPADWKQQDSTTFNAPDGAVLMVSVHAIPDGAPLADYLAGVLQGMRSVPGGADSIVIRHTEMSGVEAREVSFESPDARSVMMKRIISMAVRGPAAIGLVLITPVATAARVEPYFKSIVLSAVIMSPSESDDFEGLRSSVVKGNKAERIDGVLTVAAVLDAAGPSERTAAAPKLRSLFSASPGAVLDLAVDRRPAVRAALIDVIAASGNRAYDQFLLRALKDQDLVVAEHAARTLARLPEIADLLRSSTLEWYESERLFRVWPFLGEKVRTQIAREIFTRPNLKELSAALLEERFKKIQETPPPPPPPPPRQPPPQPRAPKIPGAEISRRPKPGARVGASIAAKEPQPNSLFGALSLLQDLPVAQCKLPFVEIAGSGSDILTASALQVAFARHERLPTEALLRLLDSSTEVVRRLSALNLAQSGALSDIPRIEERAQRLDVKSKPPLAAQETSVSKEESGRAEQGASLARLLRASIKKIRLREQLAAATAGEQSVIVKSALADADVADWAWSEYGRQQIEGPDVVATEPPSEVAGSIPATILPLGENVFPPDVKLYAAMPSPSGTLEKLAGSLNGIQMESARDQAFLVLMLSGMQAQLAKSLGARPDQSVLGVAGIDFSKPIALATWTAQGAPPGLKAAERTAVVIRVTDRERFERVLALYQENIGRFASFPEAFSIASRFIGLLPAVMPSGVKLLQQNADEPSKERPAYKYAFRASNTVLGFPVTIIERLEADSRGVITPDPICVAYAGDAAILAPDLSSLRDALSRLSRGGPALRDSPRFKQASAEGGDVVYMSDLGSLFGSGIAGKDRAKDRIDVTEGGALRISNAAWENSFLLSFKDASWAKPLQSFNPAQHSAVRDLLPGSTVMYLLAKLDAAAAWRDWKDELFGRDEIKELTAPWAVDFEKDVLPELGAECGAALMEVPPLDFKSFEWVIFFKLKSDKLDHAYREGRLLKNTPDPKGNFVKLGPGGEVAAVRYGYLIFAASEAALRKLESQNKLASARDFARGVKKAPSEVVAFGGYNLEAATAELVDSLPGDARTEVLLKAFKAIINAFHSQNFYVTASPQGLDGHMSVSLDREGRYSVAELASISKDYRPSYALVEARGTAIVDQRWLASATLRLRSKGPGAIDRIKDDIASSDQNVERISDEELRVTVRPREVKDVKKVSLPVSGAEFAPFLQPTSQIKSNDKTVIDQARKIAGDDTDAWSVARKLADWTYKNLKWKVVESSDAAHTLATREAACGEFSELYVAMARALGLPARIVVGLAYSGGSFGAHAWAEV
jgi:hypothetical protein